MKIIWNIIIMLGWFVEVGWIILEILKPETLDPAVAVFGLVCVSWGASELNHLKVMEKLKGKT